MLQIYCLEPYLLCGRPPFREDLVVKAILAHQQKQPTPLPELRPEVPAELWQLVARLLAKEPSQCYEQPIEVAQALVPFIKSEPKQEAKGPRTFPQSAESPGKGTVFELETSEVEQKPRARPAKTPPKEVPAKKEIASPFADLTDPAPEANKVETEREEEKSSRTVWWKRPGVLAGAISVSLVLIMTGVLQT